MKKSKLVLTLTVCGLALSMASAALADESDVASTLNDATSVSVTPSTPTVDSSNAATTPTASGSDTTTPSDDVAGTIDNGTGVVTGEEVTKENTTVSSDTTSSQTDKPIEVNSSTTPSSETDKQSETTTEVTTSENTTSEERPQQTVTVPEVIPATPDERENSQSGTVSQVTGQVVSDVTTATPVTLDNGATITDIQHGIATLSDGSYKKVTDLGATENSDGTFTATTNTGEKITLPHTGDKQTVGYFILGIIIVMAVALMAFKDKVKTIVTKFKHKK